MTIQQKQKLDDKYAELEKELAQKNRELEIEASLERVRMRAISMHTSDDVGNATTVLFSELENLGIKTIRCGIIIGKKEEEKIELWTATGSKKGQVVQIVGEVDVNIHPLLKGSFEAWLANKEFFSFKLEGKDKEQYYRSLASSLNYAISDSTGSLPDHYCTSFLFREGGLFAFTFEPLSPENISIFKRFAGVFSLTYRRYLDLKQAESQAREARIEAALERIRSRTLAMRNSSEVGDASALLFTELEKMDISPSGFSIMIFDNEHDKYELWRAKEVANQGVYETFSIQAMFDKLAQYVPGFGEELKSSWTKGKPFFIGEFRGKKRVSFIRANREMAVYSDDEFEKMKKMFPDPIFWHLVFFKHGWFGILQNEQLPEEDLLVIHRFAKVFEQTYTRFLDLQKAEAQAREAKIEAALERIRARSMAMQRSNELAEAAQLLYQQFHSLGIKTYTCAYMFIEEEKNRQRGWAVASDGTLLPDFFDFPLTGDTILDQRFVSWKNKQPIHEAMIQGEANKQHHTFLVSMQPPEFAQHIVAHLPDQVFFYNANFSHGYLFIINTEPLTSEEKNIAIRFAKVFNQTYTRFLDLQKAEAQAREAQIETALERVRSKTMGMQKSDELQDAALLLFQQIEGLGLPPFACGFNIWDEDRKAATAWMGSVGGLQPHFMTDSSKDVYLPIYEAAQRGESLFVKEQSAKELEVHYDYLATIPTFRDVILAGWKRDGISVPTFQIIHCAYFTQGYLMFISFEPVPAYYDIFKRFAKVFEQTYIRFLDLKKAEAQTREAVKQSSLDRVRGQIASMRNTQDLQRITPIIWHELKSLDVPFIRCGVFIMDEEKSNVQVYLSTPEGHSVAVLNLHFESGELTINTVDSWRKGTVYKVHWNKDQFIRWAQSMIDQGQVRNRETYQGSENAPEKLDLHFVPFKQGMLYVGNTSPLDLEELQLVKSLAESFSIAYSRYEDFRELEIAKNQIEKTFTELKAAQSQLIQAEKMASLGELTAGIAHEIQNPLNFVNNFSEVSNELLDEMKDEIAAGNWQLASEIADDVKQNLEKINHHGKRADAIVKGMLQHSRTSSGQKEPTDINALADEYLRLAYHGLRAKDKSFNATLKTDFDENIGKINIVPQDIGRVILNLITNAFYALQVGTRHALSLQQPPKDQPNYNPTVTVTTKLIIPTTGGMRGVLISVRDNGPGIPPHILDKIFQPFFTTKPTGEGTGLGLSLSYDIVKAHGGELKVETKEGEGTEFIILVPFNQ